MQQPDTAVWWSGWAFTLSLFSWLHPESAAGAVFGGMFFWGLNPEIPIRTRLWLLMASVGLGYGMALPAARSIDWSAWAWTLAGFYSALVHVMLVSMRTTIKTGSPLPPWMTAIRDSLPWRKNRGSDNES